MPTPDGATKVGTDLYLWKSAVNERDCVISAHGGYVFGCEDFRVPDGISLVFYNTEGSSLDDPSIGSFLQFLGRAVPVETRRAGQACRNYLLAKYQGKHGGADGRTEVESYEGVRGQIDAMDRQYTTKSRALWRALSLPAAGVDTGHLDEALAKTKSACVLTVRNRADMFMGVPLEHAVQQARRAMPSLTTFHCLFCRCLALPFTQPRTEEVAFRRG